MECQKSARVRIGTLAEEAHLMTQEQIESVNRLQEAKNARFGDLAVKNGYLTNGQLSDLLRKQPREHIVLRQILADKNILSREDFECELIDFKASLGVSDDVFAALLDNDFKAYIKHIAGIGDDRFLFAKFAETFVMLVFRLISSECMPKKAFLSPNRTVENISIQHLLGDKNMIFGYQAQDEKSACHFAGIYASAEFSALDEGVADALTEFLNCVDGMYVSELSNAGEMELDLDVPEFHADFSLLGSAWAMPLVLPFGEFCLYYM